MSDSLIFKNQSLQNIHSETIDLITQVDSFYNSAWDKLILVGAVSFAIIGVLIPIIIQWYQNKSLKISEDLLKSEIENQTLKLQNEILEIVRNELKAELAAFEDNIRKIEAGNTARACHLQALFNLNREIYPLAYSDFVKAASYYLSCKDYGNLQTVLNVILDQCIKQLSKQDIEDLKLTNDCDLEDFLDKLSKKNENGMFNKIIRGLRLALKKIPHSTS